MPPVPSPIALRPSVAPATQPTRKARRWLALSMAGAILIVGALAWWDETRESSAAFEDFAQEQSTLATSAASELSTRLAGAHRDAMVIAEETAAGRPVSSAIVDAYAQVLVRPATDPPMASGDSYVLHVPVSGGRAVDLALPAISLLREVHRVERTGELVLLLIAPSGHALLTTDGRTLTSNELVAAIDAGASAVQLTREQAAAIGLPARTAVAGVARVDAGTLGHWAVVTVATARNERDRERRARSRLLLSVLLAGGLVFVFGSIAMRKQRKELELARELAVADLQRQRDERLVRAGRIAMMGTLATGVAHELSTPLGIIAGRAEQLLGRANGDERVKRIGEAIVEQTARIGEVVRGFLDLSRGGQPTLATTEPATLVHAAVRLVEHRFEKAGVHLQCDVPTALPPVHCDVRLMEHALVNLLLNACHASPRGSAVKIVVRDDRTSISLSVVDEGCGISDEDAAHALEPFFTTKPVGQGSGLGLAITNEIVKAHRGTLTIAAATPVGTRACMQIPLAAGEESRAHD